MEKNKKVLVTGAAGFIGSHLCEQLTNIGYEVVGLDNFDSFYKRSIKEQNLRKLKKREKFTFLELDITEEKSFSHLPNNIEIVIHLAAKAGVRPSIENPKDYIKTNIEGTQKILEWMREQEVKKMIFASSSSIYGNNRKVPFSESDNVDFPISPYAYTKKACELMLHTYYHLYKIDVLCLRFFTVYGPRQRPDLAIHKFVKKIKNNIPIQMFGDGSTSRDYTYIDDIISGILNSIQYLLYKQNIYEIINLGGNNPIQLKELIDLIYEQVNKQKQIEQMPMQPGDVNRTYADISKAKTILKYNPEITIQEGIKKFVSWYDKQ